MNFSYKNKNYHQPIKKKEAFSSYWFKKIFILSFCFSSFLLVAGKITFFIKNKSTTSYQSSITSEKFKTVNLAPLVINLKSKEGPRLARVTVHMKTDKTSVKQELLSKNKSFEKHLLLVLSGQDTKDIHKKRNRFEKKIKTQINAFLSKGLVNEVTIETKLLN